MLTCQLIVALVAAAKRFDSVLHALRAAIGRIVARLRMGGGSDLQET
jgi:hypothetical protein